MKYTFSIQNGGCGLRRLQSTIHSFDMGIVASEILGGPFSSNYITVSYKEFKGSKLIWRDNPYSGDWYIRFWWLFKKEFYLCNHSISKLFHSHVTKLYIKFHKNENY